MIDLLVKECLKRGMLIELEHQDGKIVYVLHGFYKSDTVKLIGVNSVSVLAVCRYDERGLIYCWDELVMLNHKWWLRSRDRFDGWKEPEKTFAEDFKRLRLIEGD